MQAWGVCFSLDKLLLENTQASIPSLISFFFLKHTISILRLIEASLEHFIVHVKLINAYYMIAENVCFFIRSKESQNVLTTSRSLEECVESCFTQTTFLKR